jgi:hypothetical protein
MMPARELIENHMAEIIALCRRFHVRQISLFGSAASGDWDAATSDIDFLVEYGPGRASLDPLDALVGLQLALEDLLKHKVDVVDAHAIRNPVFRRNAQAGAIELYAA